MLDFAAPIWRNTIIFGVLSYSVYKFDQIWADKHEGQGYFAGVIDYYRPKEGLWESRNLALFDLQKEAAEGRLLIHSAQKPHVRQLRYPASVTRLFRELHILTQYRALDHGSPWNTRVDQIVDNSKVKVKRHNQVATAGVEDSV